MMKMLAAFVCVLRAIPHRLFFATSCRRLFGCRRFLIPPANTFSHEFQMPPKRKATAEKAESSKAKKPQETEEEEAMPVENPKGRAAKDKPKRGKKEEAEVTSTTELEPTEEMPKKRGRRAAAQPKPKPQEELEEEDDDKQENGESEKADEEEKEEPKKRGRKPKKDVKKAVIEDDAEPAPKRLKRNVKPVNNKEEDSEEEEEEEAAPKKRGRAPKKPAEEKPEKLNKATTEYDKIDFDTCSKKNENGNEFNFKISSWNVDGIKAWIEKAGMEYIKRENPDIICLQEIKSSEEKIPEKIVNIEGYETLWVYSEKNGYAGVAMLTKNKPIVVKYGLGDDEQDSEGRIITAEFEKFYVVSVYVPNAGKKLVTMPKRLEWNDMFKGFIKELDAKKPVIICGDMNVAHLEIDLKNPKTNTKNAGFTKEEREGMTEFLEAGFTDTFRHFYPEETGAYTFWTYLHNSRAKNTGWRLDYFLVSNRFKNNICDTKIRSQVFGSDHCPIVLFLEA